jgi:O-6-methylguanine DNA methyltransferase
MTPFAWRVYWVVRRIPRGRVATYGDVARWAGRPRAHRAVGTAMRQCDDPGVPCHRVVAAGGRLGGYGGRPEEKRRRLQQEGIRLGGERIRQFTAMRWRPTRKSLRLPTPSDDAIV